MSDNIHTKGRDASCEARLPEHLKGREAQFAQNFASSAPEPDDREAALAYIDAAVDEFGYEMPEGDDGVKAVVTLLREAPADADLDEITVPESNETYGGDTLYDAVADLLGDIERDTSDRRSERINESILAVSTTITMRIELSTGGPADYITADVDPDDRGISDVRYHFADWFDHADRSVDDNSPLYRLAEYYAEIVDLGRGE